MSPALDALQTVTAHVPPLDPLWYRDATIYQLHVKSFCDSNGDGIGDFNGLIQKLDYIVELGADTIWLMPFYPSPRRDDGYDISDYRDVHPDYGTMDDFRRFVVEAHARGIRVVTELVINHTSDQHPWFKRARSAPAGSPERDFYVWSDNDQAYAGTRVIFVDTEKSNWTWDTVAGAYFWHRFYSHQPDLNFDNPHVLEAVLDVMRFWLDVGIDGLRLDAVPYLVEREGTSNENLPETHAILKRIRAELDAYAPGRMLLAEANQWPEDAQQYFGDGDECNMSFHFPLMPRMYMAIAQEDRFPITDIMRQTPEIPDTCQWVVFLRNHDELTLEMVTNSERDYLWNTYAADRRARLNLGIRRRLAPLLEHDRRRIELMTGLLMSMPGTPVIYYGDEIGMGDNIHLGDRDGVRTPMQWSSDRNGGFSRCAPEALVLPVIMDSIYGFAAVNVEAQAADPYSQLNWTRRLLAVRRAHPAFGRGAQRFLRPTNRKILAFLRSHEHETLLCVSNLSRTAQAVELDLQEFTGRVPVDLLGGSAFPAIGRLPYLLTAPPFAFYWFILAHDSDLTDTQRPAPTALPDYTTLVLRRGLADIFTGLSRTRLENEILPPYLALRRWFSGKDKHLDSVSLASVVELAAGASPLALVELAATLDGEVERFLLPLAIAWEDDAHDPMSQILALARVRLRNTSGLLTDAFAMDALPRSVVHHLRSQSSIDIEGGRLRFDLTSSLDGIAEDAAIHRLSAEQSNSSLVIGTTAILKVIRHIAEGINPEIEVSDHLTRAGFANAPAMLGSVWREMDDGSRFALMVLQGFVPNQGDGWTWVREFLARTGDDLAVSELPDDDSRGAYAQFAAAIGTRLGQLHAVLAAPCEDAAFAPVEAGAAEASETVAAVQRQFDKAMAAIAATTGWADEGAAHDATYLLEHQSSILAVIAELGSSLTGTLRTRIHGDFHLGQVLVAHGDAYIVDFEGEPSRPLAERRAKDSPLRDVAGMVRSFDYARAMARLGSVPLGSQASERREPILDRLHEDAVAAFLEAYDEAHASADRRWAKAEAQPALLDLFLIQKAAYEVCYEAANRVTWLPVPMRGLAQLTARLITAKAEPTDV